MDTKKLELQAEKLIISRLLKYDLKVIKPDFDIEGTDLLIVKNISDLTTPFLKVQCKGRSIGKNNSNIKIPVEYVKENFIVVIYIVEETKDDFIYVFLKNDINKWRNDGNNFCLTIPKDFQYREEFRERLFNQEVVTKIQAIFIEQEVKIYHSIIIDGIFLGNAVKKTRKIYRELYPEKNFFKPSIDNIIKECLEYVNITKDKEINCYVVHSPHYFNLEYFVDIQLKDEDEDENYLSRIDYEVENEEAKIYNELGFNYRLIPIKTKIEEFIYFKVEEIIERYINTENIVLLADDNAYNPLLNELKNKGVEVILFHHTENDGSRMYHKFKWANITYPLALSMGLNRYEL